VIEPQRQALIPGFADVRRGAMAAGALGCSISGAGPSMFAWALEATAPKVLAAMREAFARHSLATDEWVVELRSDGARVIG
jgi:homoserine kinase